MPGCFGGLAAVSRRLRRSLLSDLRSAMTTRDPGGSASGMSGVTTSMASYRPHPLASGDLGRRQEGADQRHAVHLRLDKPAQEALQALLEEPMELGHQPGRNEGAAHQASGQVESDRHRPGGDTIQAGIQKEARGRPHQHADAPIDPSLDRGQARPRKQEGGRGRGQKLGQGVRHRIRSGLGAVLSPAVADAGFRQEPGRPWPRWQTGSAAHPHSLRSNARRIGPCRNRTGATSRVPWRPNCQTWCPACQPPVRGRRYSLNGDWPTSIRAQQPPFAPALTPAGYAFRRTFARVNRHYTSL